MRKDSLYTVSTSTSLFMYSVTMDGLCCSWTDIPTEDAPPLSNSAEDDDDDDEDEEVEEEEEEEVE